MKSEYDIQAETFLKETNTKFKATYLDHNYYFTDDKDTRDVYRITLSNNRGRISFKFGQSIAETGKKPSAYSVLACLEKYEYIDFNDFCSNFGYDTDSRKAEKTYKAVKKEYEKLCKIFTEEEIEKLREIQ